MLRDQIVCGINDPQIQCCLLAEHELTYQSAFELVQSMETADQNTPQAAPQSEPRSTQDDFHYIPQTGNQSPHFIAFVVEVTIKLQIASTRMLFARTIKKRSLGKSMPQCTS